MRFCRIGIVVAVGLGVLGIDVGESVRVGGISDASAQAKRHHRRHKSRKRHRKHHRRATEM
jgi:hypothetical protein